MNILDSIIEHKRVEVLSRRQKRPLSDLKSFPLYTRKTNVIDTQKLEEAPGIIAEFKRQSPSKGPINMEADPVRVAEGYGNAGVSAMSILTDRKFFGGSFMDLKRVKESNPGMVLLRKDFIIDGYQLHEALAYGADMVLLIAANLDQQEVADLSLEARSLGLSVLFEVHSEDEMEKYHPAIEYVGVNNRNLKTFTVDTRLSLNLIGQMPEGVVPVSESGLSSGGEVLKLYKAGYKLFLMGEAFMRETDPGLASTVFMEQLKNANQNLR